MTAPTDAALAEWHADAQELVDAGGTPQARRVLIPLDALAAAREVLGKLDRMGKSIASDLRNTHRGRADAASEWMRDDDRDLRSEFTALLTAARAHLPQARVAEEGQRKPASPA